MTSHSNPVAIFLMAPGNVYSHSHHATTQRAFFTHNVRNKANSIWFAHQSLCSPRISTLLKAIRHNHLKGCPNLSAAGVSKYLNPSPATTKGHMKQPCMGIRSTRRTHIHTATLPQGQDDPNDTNIVSVNQLGIISLDNSSVASAPPRPSNANIIVSDDESSDANIFCFAAFSNKQTGTLFNDLTGAFLLMSLEGNICFLILYHYETNAILALLIKGFGDDIIFAAYKQQCNMLEAKGYKIKLNIMDNQATKIIKTFLDEKQCNLFLVKPHNHRVNAAKRAIQTFNAHFIGALAATDTNFPLQMWDCLTLQVKSTLNMLRPSRIDTKMSAYEAVHAPYN